MSEVRTTSSSGGQKGVKPQRHSLIPKEGLDTIAEVFAFGATKYSSHNWRRGYEWSKSYDALIRHLTAWWAGEDLDPESGLSHLGHAGFHIMALSTWQRDGGYEEFDDRYRPAESVEAEEERLLDEQHPPRFVVGQHFTVDAKDIESVTTKVLDAINRRARRNLCGND